MSTIRDSFWEHLHKRPDGCWVWTRGVNSKGSKRLVGLVWDGARYVPSHRFAWELANGPVPPGKLVKRRCKHALCCNPAHLYIPEARTYKGARKLTKEAVAKIRRDYEAGQVTQTALAREHNVDPSMISRIVRGERMKD